MKLMRAIQDSRLFGAVVLLLGACGGAGVGITAAAVTDAALGNTALAAAAQAGVQCAPPPEAVAACAGHAKDDACQIALPEHTLDGTCAQLADGSLACRPPHPPRPPPPPEATAACAALAAGAACSFTHGDHTVQGTCKADDHAAAGSALACAPERKGPPPEATAACTGLASGASCSFKLGEHDLTGTCRAGPDNAALSCAPPCPRGPPPGPHGGPPHG
jgi:hypothetical protein